MRVRGPGANRAYNTLLALTASATLSACGGDDTPTAPSPGGGAGTITSFEVSAALPAATMPLPSPFSPHIWALVNQPAQLTARVGESNNPPRDVTANVEWRVTNGAVASVSSTGLLTGLRPGQTPLLAVYQGQNASTFLSVFATPPTVGGPFTGLLQLRERKPYFITVGASGGSIVFVLTSAGPGSGLLGVMFGSADATAPTCRPPYAYGASAIQTQDAGTGNRSDARTSFFQSAPGRYCVIVLDPATVTAEDQVPSGTNLNGMNFPVNYTLTIGVSGPGASVTP